MEDDSKTRKLNDTSSQRRISKAWLSFAAKLAVVLAQIEEDQILILSRKNHEQDVVQFVGQGEFGLRVEVISNFFRSPENQLSEAQIGSLTALGWHLPTGSDEASTPTGDPDGSPNFYVELPQAIDCSEIAQLAIATITEIFNISHPGWLEYQAFESEGNSISFPALGLKPQIAPDTTENLRDTLLSVVRELTGIPDLGYNANGEFSGIRYGNAVTYLNLPDDRPYMRCFSLLMTELEMSFPLLARINELNAQNGHMHLYAMNGGIVAISDVLVVPLVTSHIAYAIGNFIQIADEMSLILQQEFGKDACQFIQTTNPVTH